VSKCFPAVLAAFSVLHVHGAVLPLLAGEELVVLGLDGAPEEGAARGADLTAVVGVAPRLLAAHLAEVLPL